MLYQIGMGNSRYQKLVLKLMVNQRGQYELLISS